MAEAADDFAAWLDQADIPASYRTAELDALLHAVFRFRQQQGSDYYSTRLLSHFLLHAGTDLKVAQIARLLGISRPNASKQQNLSSKEAIRQAHHRMDGRPHGKLLPRFVGPIAAFLVGHPDASRAELLDFIEQTFSVRVSRIALYKFLKKYGLQDGSDSAEPDQAKAAEEGSTASSQESAASKLTASLVPLQAATPAELTTPVAAAAPQIELISVSEPARPAPPFCSDGRNTPAPSC